MNTEPLRVFIRTPTRSAREKRKQSLRREIRIHRKSAREGKPYAEERRGEFDRSRRLVFVIFVFVSWQISSVVSINLVGFSISNHGHRVALFEEVFFLGLLFGLVVVRNKVLLLLLRNKWFTPRSTPSICRMNRYWIRLPERMALMKMLKVSCASTAVSSFRSVASCWNCISSLSLSLSPNLAFIFWSKFLERFCLFLQFGLAMIHIIIMAEMLMSVILLLFFFSFSHRCFLGDLMCYIALFILQIHRF